MKSKRPREEDAGTADDNMLASIPFDTPNSPFTRGKSSGGGQIIVISTGLLLSEHENILILLWHHLIQQRDSTLAVILNLFHSDFGAASVELTTSQFAAKKSAHIQIRNLLLQFPIALSEVLWKAFLLALRDNGFEINAFDFAVALNGVAKKINDVDPALRTIFANLAELYRVTKHQTALQLVLTELMPVLIRTNHLCSFSKLVDLAVLKLIARHIDESKSTLLLHYALGSLTTTTETIDKVVELLDGRPSHPVDADGNTLTHVCRHPKYLQSGLLDANDILTPNHAGDFPIHQAARTNNLTKANHLFRKMQFPEVRNHITQETIYDIESDKKLSVDVADSFNLYRKFKKKHGVVLSVPPVSLQQNGHTCGLYAVDCAARHYYTTQPELFSHSVYIPPRKSDAGENAEYSLRAHHRSTVGEVLSVSELVNLVALTGNQCIVLDVKAYDEFLRHIQIAIQHDFPVILPFNMTNAGPGVGENATRAHWANIIGYYEEKGEAQLLIAQYARYDQYKALDIFNSCVATNPLYPHCYFFKDKASKRGWVKTLAAPPTAPNREIREIKERKLTDFFGKMVVVLPPDLDKEKVSRLLGSHLHLAPVSRYSIN